MKKNPIFSLVLFGLMVIGTAHAADAGWPRKIETSHGVVTLSQPLRVLFPPASPSPVPCWRSTPR